MNEERVELPGWVTRRYGSPLFAWLMEGDAAIRFRALSELGDWDYDEDELAAFGAAQAAIATDGWGAELLARQDPATGLWDGGLYNPKWTSTHYTLLLLAHMRLPRGNEQAKWGARVLIDAGIRPDGGINYGGGESETCITGMALRIGARFGVALEQIGRMADHLLAEQMEDGGWNCQRRRGATHASFHTTICVLEGLQEYVLRDHARRPVARAAAAHGREFLLNHRMFRSHRTGAVVKPALTRFSFPVGWHYDVLRGLEVMSEPIEQRDARLEDAMDLLRKKQRRDGTWALQNRHRGRYWFDMETVGEPSRWNTVRALGILRRWDSGGEVQAFQSNGGAEYAEPGEIEQATRLASGRGDD